MSVLFSMQQPFFFLHRAILVTSVARCVQGDTRLHHEYNLAMKKKTPLHNAPPEHCYACLGTAYRLSCAAEGAFEQRMLRQECAGAFFNSLRCS